MAHDNMTWPNYSAQEHLLYSVISFLFVESLDTWEGSGDVRGTFNWIILALLSLHKHTQLPIHHRPRNMSGVVIVRTFATLTLTGLQIFL